VAASSTGRGAAASRTATSTGRRIAMTTLASVLLNINKMLEINFTPQFLFYTEVILLWLMVIIAYSYAMYRVIRFHKKVNKIINKTKRKNDNNQ
jgi:hypothetical protein